MTHWIILYLASLCFSFLAFIPLKIIGLKKSLLSGQIMLVFALISYYLAATNASAPNVKDDDTSVKETGIEYLFLAFLFYTFFS